MNERAVVTCQHVGSLAAGFVDGIGFMAAVIVVTSAVVLYTYHIYLRERT